MRGNELSNATLEDISAHLDRMVAGREFRVSEVCDVLLKKAVLAKTSDIHLEPTKRGTRVRYRIDGVLRDAALLPSTLHDQLVSRIKVLSDLLTHRRDIVQEGRISIVVGDHATDLRVSIVPTVGGEKAVIRVFSMHDAVFSLSEVGYSDDMQRRLKAVLFDLEGLFLLTGPSGSGKTTTLYSILNEIQREMEDFASITTIEDPVEYEFGTFSQMQVNRQVDFDFAAGLKAALRQDPEVIMVGEIRDVETGEVALRAGLTGHMVLSTLHSGSAPETVTRLINMGLEPFVVASALTGTIAQRLVRRLCPECVEPHELDPMKLELIQRLSHLDADAPPPEFFRGKGCEACGFSGFSGRLPIAEFLSVDEDLRGLILDKARTGTIRRHLLSKGWKSLFDDGLQKAQGKLTTFEEVMRRVSLREVL
ncbi:MAG: type II/IV secretion system protein [Planctomycetes bacterium]|nr:type II/IV secretion system protein [Planctomycetota bacterium]